MKKQMMGWLLTIALVITSFAVVPMGVQAEQMGDSNVMMVIDGSGSLSMHGGTDVEGFRYEAIDLFLGLLPDSGNKVGAIVFDDSQPMPLNSGLLDIQSTEDKRVLSEKIKNAEAGGDTDIGNALQAALAELAETSEAPEKNSFLLLFSDGETDLDNNSDMQASLAQKEDAMETAKKLGIPIHGICLNTNNSANTSEVKKLADETGGIYLEIRSADDLGEVFTQLYRLINGDQDPIQVAGEFEKTFQVPSYGVKEVAVVIRNNGQQVPLTMIRPNNIAMSDMELAAISINGSTYQMVKLVSPEAGIWTLQGHGDPNTEIYLNFIYNTDLGADIECDMDTNHIPLNSQVDIRGYLLLGDQRVAEETPYLEYSATLVMQNATTGAENLLPMQSDGASYFSRATLDEYGTYYATLKLTCDNIERSSKSIVLNVGNSAPTAIEETVKKTVSLTPFSSGKVTFDMNDYVSDEEDSALDYSLGYYSYSNGAVTLDNNVLTIDAKDARSGLVTVVARDSGGAFCEVNFEVVTKNLTLLFILIPLLILAIILFVVVKKKSALKNTVCNYTIMVESFDNETGMYSAPFSQSGFKGKLPLGHFQINECGVHGEFQAIPVKGKKFGKCEFVSKEKFETEAGMLVNKIAINEGDDLRLYAPSATEENRQQKGVHIIVEMNYDF